MTDRKVSIGCSLLISEVNALDKLAKVLGIARNRLIRVYFLEMQAQISRGEHDPAKLEEKWRETP